MDHTFNWVASSNTFQTFILLHLVIYCMDRENETAQNSQATLRSLVVWHKSVDFPDDSDAAHKPWSFIFLSASVTCLISICFETESHNIALIGLEF